MNSKGSDFIGAFFMSDDFLILSSCLSAWFYMDYPCEKNNFLVKHAQLLKDSYRHLLLKDLIQNTDSDEAFARQLFHAPFAVVSHDTASDQVFNYANLKALELFELNWEDFTDCLPGCPQNPLIRKSVNACWQKSPKKATSIIMKAFVSPVPENGL